MGTQNFRSKGHGPRIAGLLDVKGAYALPDSVAFPYFQTGRTISLAAWHDMTSELQQERNMSANEKKDILDALNESSKGPSPNDLRILERCREMAAGRVAGS